MFGLVLYINNCAAGDQGWTMVHILLSLHYGLCVSFLFGLGAFGESSKMLKLPESTTMQPHRVKIPGSRGKYKWALRVPQTTLTSSGVQANWDRNNRQLVPMLSAHHSLSTGPQRAGTEMIFWVVSLLVTRRWDQWWEEGPPSATGGLGVPSVIRTVSQAPWWLSEFLQCQWMVILTSHESTFNLLLLLF